MNNKLFWGMTSTALALVAIASGTFFGYKKIKSLKQENENLRLENTIQVNENEKLKIDLKEYQNKLTLFQTQIENLTLDKKNLLKQVNDLNSQISQKDNQINSLTTTLQTKEQELAVQTAYLETCQNKAVEIKTKIETLTQEDSQLNAQAIATLQDDLLKIEIEVTNVETKIQSLNVTITNLNSDIAVLTQEKQNLQTTVDTLNAQVGSLNKQIESLNKRIQELESSNYYFRVIEGTPEVTLMSNILKTYVSGYNTINLTYNTSNFEKLVNGNDIVKTVINNTKYSIETNIFDEYSEDFVSEIEYSLQSEYSSDFDYLENKQLKYNLIDVFGNPINLSDFTDGDKIILSNITCEFAEDSDFVMLNATMSVLNTIPTELLGHYFYNANNVSYKVDTKYVYEYCNADNTTWNLYNIIEYKNDILSMLDKNQNVKSIKFANNAFTFINDEDNSIEYQKYLDGYSIEKEISGEYLGIYKNKRNSLVVTAKNIQFSSGLQLIDYDEVSHVALFLSSDAGFVYVTFKTEDDGTIKAVSRFFFSYGGDFTKVS